MWDGQNKKKIILKTTTCFHPVEESQRDKEESLFAMSTLPLDATHNSKIVAVGNMDNSAHEIPFICSLNQITKWVKAQQGLNSNPQ